MLPLCGCNLINNIPTALKWEVKTAVVMTQNVTNYKEKPVEIIQQHNMLVVLNIGDISGVPK